MLSTIARSTVRAVAVARHVMKPTTTKMCMIRPTSSLLNVRCFSAVTKDSKPVTRVEEDEDEDEEDDNPLYSNEGMPDFEHYTDDSHDPPVAKVGELAPHWDCNALVDGEIKHLSSEHFWDKWTVLFFYPLDFTFVCPTEIRAFSDRYDEFQKLGVSVVACSVDSEYAHLAWTKMPKEEGGLGPMRIPILADKTKSIAKKYGVLIEKEGVALRGLFIIDPHGILRQSTINDLPIGRSVDETLRLLQAFLFHEKHGEVCPSDWKPGQDGMTTDAEGLRRYFQKK